MSIIGRERRLNIADKTQFIQITFKKMPAGGVCSRDFDNNYLALISAWGNRVETLVVTLRNLPVGVAVVVLDARSCGRIFPTVCTGAV
jgi:hypothetical protein